MSPLDANAERTDGRLVRPHMPELDTLRGVAIIAVLFFHGFYWRFAGLHFSAAAATFLQATRAGWLGVNLFFVLSGFLITGILLDSKCRPQYFRAFYVRRALRILPLYYSVLTFIAAGHLATRSYVILSFLYLANLTVLFGVPDQYGPLWSLAVEEHFYLLLADFR